MDINNQNLPPLKVVCISDTHSQTNHLTNLSGDILIHAGDFTSSGGFVEVTKFVDFLSKLNFKHKIVIAGNHELTLDEEIYQKKLKKAEPYADRVIELQKNSPSNLIEKIKTQAIYLQNSGVEIEGYKIWGSPQTPEFYDWAFMYSPADADEIWKQIPQDTEILVTHGPPKGILDHTYGCRGLLKKVQEVKPKFHIFGHIHESYGVEEHDGVVFINASILNQKYFPVNDPVVFELPRKK